MSAPAVVVWVISPRTADEPMAFTREEFWRGAYSAWAWYLVCLVPISLVMGGGTPLSLGVLMFAALYGVPVSLLAMMVWSPVAWPLGRVLRRVRSMAIHVTCFGLFGLGIGVVTMWLFGLAMGGAAFDELLLAPYAFAAAVAVPFGWWRAARRALASDATARRILDA